MLMVLRMTISNDNPIGQLREQVLVGDCEGRVNAVKNPCVHYVSAEKKITAFKKPASPPVDELYLSMPKVLRLNRDSQLCVLRHRDVAVLHLPEEIFLKSQLCPVRLRTGNQ